MLARMSGHSHELVCRCRSQTSFALRHAPRLRFSQLGSRAAAGVARAVECKEDLDLREVTKLPQVVKAVNGVTPKLFIDGKFVDATSGETYDNICPTNEQPIVAVSKGGPEDVKKAVAAARHAFDEGPWGSSTSSSERGRLLYKLADLMEEHAEELAVLEAIDNGKTFATALAVDIPTSIDNFRYNAGWADKLYGDTIPTNDGTVAWTMKEPVGVVGSIIPWNFPLLMLAWKVAPALAAGCTVVLKVSEQTPLTALKIAELSVKAGIPPGVLNILPGFGDLGAALCNEPGVDKLAFTGSTEVGKLVMHSAADRILNVSLELGGKSPLIVCPDADVQSAAEIAHKGQFFNGSQNCAASTRIYVHESMYDEFIKKSVELAESVKIGNPFDEASAQGPQVDKQQFEKYHRYLKQGQEEGATLHCGGGAAADIGYFVKPVIFGDVQEHMSIFKEEIFGPVASIVKYKDIDEAIASANNTEYGLAAGIVTQHCDTMNKLVSKLRAGTIWVNTYNTQHPAVPFGGFKMSGIHRDKGREGIEKYLETKSVVMKTP